MGINPFSKRGNGTYPLFALLAVLLVACADGSSPPGRIEGGRRPDAASRHRADANADAAAPKQILFGDLHVHTTYSVDAFVYSLPFLGGEGAHPPADACDFARFCAGLDFFALTDHAEGLTPEQWQASKQSLRECNARAGDPSDPDLVAFAGWEWTQVGATPETHYGHKNVIFPGLADDELPARPISSLDDDVMQRAPSPWLLRSLQAIRLFGLSEYADFLALIGRLAVLPNCAKGVDTRELPADCRENAPTPAELFEKLGQWGFEALVIPHGLAWGLHAPPGARLDNQLNRAQHDPSRQRLIEIFSGHGNSEEYRPWSPIETAADGSPACPAETADFLPCCRRAGQIMRARCGDLPAEECEARVAEAERLALEAAVAPHLVFPDTRPEDWLDCDQCRDCFKPALSLRPGESAQYSLAISNFEDGAAGVPPLRFRWGFIASSDDHKAQPGTGYKQVARRMMTDARGFRSPTIERFLRPRVMGSQGDPQRPESPARGEHSFASLLDAEREASFLYPGGLVAVHAGGRDRMSIWRALDRREVYGTSGPRILLWFDVLNALGGRAPMGSEVEVAETPRFEVRAVGSLKQLPGCPEASLTGLSAERLERLCRGHCNHPSDARHPIVAVEVVRIRPQDRPGENVDSLIEDPWRRVPCDPDPNGCVVQFEDPEFIPSGRETIYYVRALQEETPAINGANFRTEFDAAGNPVRITPCYGNYRTPADDDCLAPVRERAWSSPVFIDFAPVRGGHAAAPMGVADRGGPAGSSSSPAVSEMEVPDGA